MLGSVWVPSTNYWTFFSFPWINNDKLVQTFTFMIWIRKMPAGQKSKYQSWAESHLIECQMIISNLSLVWNWDTGVVCLFLCLTMEEPFNGTIKVSKAESLPLVDYRGTSSKPKVAIAHELPLYWQIYLNSIKWWIYQLLVSRDH